MNTSNSSASRGIASSRFVLMALLIASVAGCQQEIISSAPSSRAKGIKEFNEGNYADAAGTFRNALRSDPRDYKSQFYLAQSYEQLKQYQQSIQAYKASLDAQTRTLAGKEDIAQRLVTLDALAGCISKTDNSDAELNLIEQQAKSSNKSQDYLLLGKIHQNRGDADSALDAYNRGALADPKDFVIVKQYGLYLEQVGQKQKAVYTLKKAYALKANDSEVNDALRRLNIVPGPGLKDQDALVKPDIPVGPLPEVNLSKFRLGGTPQPAAEAPAVAPAPAPAAEYAPRD
ncbi:MAG: tetratricopeptide repeat protein [Tepidisphaeraceae bacterium]